jgi:hypothetical protein
MMTALPFPPMSLARSSGVLMLLFTDRYYRSCARQVGLAPWPGDEHTLSLLLRSFGHTISRRWSAQTIRAITTRMSVIVPTARLPETPDRVMRLPMGGAPTGHRGLGRRQAASPHARRPAARRTSRR